MFSAFSGRFLTKFYVLAVVMVRSAFIYLPGRSGKTGAAAVRDTLRSSPSGHPSSSTLVWFRSVGAELAVEPNVNSGAWG